MRYISIALVLSWISLASYSQQTDLNTFNKQRQQISKKALLGLSAYAGASIIYGTIASGQTSGNSKYFHQMNAIWNGITLGIVTIGKLTSKKERELTLLHSLKKQNNIEKLFLFNTGLDLAYIAAGAYLQERGKTTTKNPGRLKGYGRSIVLQGAILFLFDGVMYMVHHNHGKKLNKSPSKLQIVFSGNEISAIFHL